MDRNFRSGFDNRELDDICEKASSVNTDLFENLLVNIFTIPDVALDLCVNGNNELVFDKLQRMYEGKINDYKRFVVISEKFDGVPSKIKNLLKYSPCGLCKLAALHYRNI